MASKGKGLLTLVLLTTTSFQTKR